MSNKYIYSLDNRKILLNSLNLDFDVYDEIKNINNPNDIASLINNGYLKPQGIANNISETSKVGDDVDCVLLCKKENQSIYRKISEFDVFIDNDIIMILKEGNNKILSSNNEIEDIVKNDFNSISQNNLFKLKEKTFYDKYQEIIKMNKDDVKNNLNNSDFDTNISMTLFLVNDATGLHSSDKENSIPKILEKLNKIREDNFIRLSNFLNESKTIDGKLKINFNNAYMLYKMNKNDLPIEYIENKMGDKFNNKMNIDNMIKTLDIKNIKNTKKADNYFQRKFNSPYGKSDMFST